MGHIFRLCLFGHRDFSGYRVLDTVFFELIKNIVETNDYVEIYVGRNGEFDIYATSVVKRVQKIMERGNSELICVLPYSCKNIEFYSQYYDDVIIPEAVESSHPKNAITKRNQWMVEMCDLVVCYVENADGGAYRAIKYARKLNKEIINLTHID